MSETDEVVLLVDMDTKRPGCVLLQAVYGGDSDAVSELFNSERWVLFPTKDMQLIRGTRAQWRRLSAKLNESAKEESEKR